MKKYSFEIQFSPSYSLRYSTRAKDPADAERRAKAFAKLLAPNIDSRGLMPPREWTTAKAERIE